MTPITLATQYHNMATTALNQHRDWATTIQQRLQRQQQQHRRRQLHGYAVAGDALLRDQHSGQTLINFSGNDYLGLSQHPALRAALADTGGDTGGEHAVSGAGASRLVSGNRPEHEDLEQALATLFKRDDALCFSSGFIANLSILQALAQRDDVLLLDKLSHASLIDGGRLASADLQRYRHADSNDCQQRLQASSRPGMRMIASDGVFSMDGDQAPVRQLAALAAAEQALLVIDDAHGIGVLGEQGLGLLEQEGLGQTEVPLLIGTFGKSFGLAGAFVTGDAALIDYLRNSCRGLIYSTAPPPPLLRAQLQALRLLQDESWRRERLRENIDWFVSRAKTAGIPLLPSTSAIQPLLIGANQAALQAQESLRQQGLLVVAIRPPTVPEGTARLRITLSAVHSKQQLQQLLAALSQLELPA